MVDDKIKPQSELHSSHLTMLNTDCKKYLDLATRPEPTKRKVHQGLGLVINQREFLDASNNRLGTELDVRNLVTTFEKFGCPLRVESDLNDQEIREAIDKFVYDVEDTPDLDYLVMVILSHGQFNARTNSSEFFDRDMKPVELDSQTGVINRVMNQCVSMQHKPKLFIVQACRQHEDEESATSRRNSIAALSSSLSTVQIDEKPRRNLPHAYWISINATIKNAYAMRNPKTGSLMVSTLCQVLRDNWKQKDIKECFDLAHQKIPNAAMREGFNQNPEVAYAWPTLFYLSDDNLP